MTETRVINIQIPHKIDKPLDTHLDYFTDCVFVCSQGEVPAHRIVLARLSPVLNEYFMKNPIRPGEKVKIDVSILPESGVRKFLELIYKESLVITWRELPMLIKLAYDFKIDSLMKLLEQALLDAVDHKNIIQILGLFKKYDAYNACLSLTAYTAQQLCYAYIRDTDIFIQSEEEKNLILTGKPLCGKNPQEILMALPSIKFFTKVIREHNFLTVEYRLIKDGPKQTQTNIRKFFANDPKKERDLKLTLIDNFVKDKTITYEDYQDLISVTPFEEGNYTDLTHHECLWLEPTTKRKLYSGAISARRQILTECGDSFEASNLDNRTKKEFSPWYPFSWLTEIQNSTVLQGETPVHDIIQFIQTLGGYTKHYDAQALNLINITPIGNTMSEIFTKENILSSIPNKYLIIYGIGFKADNRVGFRLTLGDNKTFSFKTIEVSLYIRRKIMLTNEDSSKYLEKRSYPETLNLYFKTRKVRGEEENIITAKGIELEEGDLVKYTFEHVNNPKGNGASISSGIESFEVLLKEKESKIFPLRVSSVKIYGSFKP